MCNSYDKFNSARVSPGASRGTITSVSCLSLYSFLSKRMSAPLKRNSMPDYTIEHAIAGINAKLPTLETWPNQFPGYTITTRFPEYSSVCPKTGLPDFGTITIQYMPKKDCIELKALKMYLLAYRELGIFYENAVNKILRDIVAAVQPEWCVVRGEFTPRGGLTTTVFCRWRA